jgi:hypothetical protein
MEPDRVDWGIMGIVLVLVLVLVLEITVFLSESPRQVDRLRPGLTGLKFIDDF